MSVETALPRHTADRQIVKGKEKDNGQRRITLFEYPEYNGHPASSRYNWVPTDYLIYRFAKLLGVADVDLKKNKNT